MSEEAAPQVEVPVLPPPHDPSAMGTLANAAETFKRPATETAAAPAAKKSKAAGNEEWNALLTQIRGHLRGMNSDECFSRALELQMLARSEVGTRSEHLSNAMDMATGGGMAQSDGQRMTKAEREASKQKPINTNNTMPVPCMKMTPPLPPRCEHDTTPGMEIPAFSQLVNFPTARYYNKCVMCESSEFNIPKQNKGVCNNCDVAIWVVNPSGMNIKWCKGCKNFKKWVMFGVKGYSSKCEPCRNKQAKRYSGNKTNQAAEVANVADTAATAAALNAIAVPQVPVGAPVLPLPPVVPQEEAGAEPPAPNAQV